MASTGIAAALSFLGFLFPVVVLLDAAGDVRNPSMGPFEAVLRFGAVAGCAVVALVATHLFLRRKERAPPSIEPIGAGRIRPQVLRTER